MTTTTYTVTGMTCGHCEKSVAEEVEKLAGVTGLSVSAATGTLRIDSTGPLAEVDVLAAVEEAGYSATPA